MTDTTSHGSGSGPSHRAVEIGVAIAMVAFGAIVIYGSLQVGIGWGAEGPRAGFFPFYVGRRDHRSPASLNLLHAPIAGPAQGVRRLVAAAAGALGRHSDRGLCRRWCRGSASTWRRSC